MPTEHVSLRTAAINHAELRAQIAALTDDEQAIADTLEGVSDFRELMIIGARKVKEQEALLAGLRDYIGELQMRAERMEGSIKNARYGMAVAMLDSGEKAIKDASVTISARVGAPKVIITNELTLPEGYLTPVTKYVADKDAIRAELEAGRPVAGAQLSNGQPVLTLRVR